MKKIIFFAIIVLGLGLLSLFYLNEEQKRLEILPENMLEESKIKLEISPKEAIKKVLIITVYDNYQFNPELKTGWGFSCLVKVNEENILFDTGADGQTLLNNMEKLEISPTQIDKIVLSHIHGDHTGGLDGILEKNKNIVVYIPNSFPDFLRREIESYGAKYKNIKESEEISKGVFSTGELGTWIKEQSLIINTDKGLVIITGCAHPGVVNIIKKTKDIFPNKNIYLVLGGFHLTGASDSELRDIINNFRKLGVEIPAPCHCSGDRARELFKKDYQDNFIENGVGKIIKI